MSEAIDLAYQAIDEEHRDEPASTRRQLVAGAGATLGGLGLLSIPGLAWPGDAEAGVQDERGNKPQNILNVAATAEVLATIVNTVGGERVPLDSTTQRNVDAAAREELIHYDVLVDKFGAKPLTRRIWVPDSVFENSDNFLSTLVVGDQIFINAYLIATQVFAKELNGPVARFAAEFMGAEAVHRALARQSLGLLGNDRVFMKFARREQANGPGEGMKGFKDVNVAVRQLENAGFGFGEPGARPGAFYNFGQVRQRTPNPRAVNNRRP